MNLIPRAIVAAAVAVLAVMALRGGLRSPIQERIMQDRAAARKLEKATFAAGCFWGVEAEFRRLKGVTSTAVGYTGGTRQNPTYPEVCTGATGHAEAVELEYDPDRISYDQLLDVFWNAHDPTAVNRQGPDVGTQYRSAIFCHGDEQLRRARASKERLEKSGRFRKPIATEIVLAPAFFRAEEYHQQYYEKNGLKSCPVR